jgi:hypothetical protein
MATPAVNLAASLEALKSLQDQEITAIRAAHLTRIHRERLLKNGFIREVIKGWYVPTRPDEAAGESTAWYACFWAFCANYLTQRFGNDWCLSPEQSLALHTGDWTVPRQALVRTSKGGNKPVLLLFGTSILDARLDPPAPADTEILAPMRIYTLTAALIACSPTHFTAQTIMLRAALAAITESSDLLRRLLDGGHSRVAGRLAGAFRNIGRAQIADSILQAMRAAGYKVVENDPFIDLPLVTTTQESAPVQRMRMTWERMRNDVLEHFGPPPKKAAIKASYLRQVDESYVTDAYNSLSIEGYRVNVDLIEQVRSGNWNPQSVQADRNQRDALAARGYWQAFQRVKQSLGRVLDGKNPGNVAQADHSSWYLELFGPSVTAGLIKASELAGYRNGPVYIRHSMHVPARAETLRDLMPAFFDLLRNEVEPAVRVVLGHFMFVYIHPYFDGNGRMGRFLMNVMMAAGGYRWTIVPLDARTEYMAALEAASVSQDIVPFAQFLNALINSPDA